MYRWGTTTAKSSLKSSRNWTACRVPNASLVCVCLYLCLCLCLCLYVYVLIAECRPPAWRVSVFLCVCVCVYVCVCMCLLQSAERQLGMCVGLYLCLHVYVFAYVCVCVCVCLLQGLCVDQYIYWNVWDEGEGVGGHWRGRGSYKIKSEAWNWVCLVGVNAHTHTQAHTHTHTHTLPRKNISTHMKIHAYSKFQTHVHTHAGTIGGLMRSRQCVCMYVCINPIYVYLCACIFEDICSYYGKVIYVCTGYIYIRHEYVCFLAWLMWHTSKWKKTRKDIYVYVYVSACLYVYIYSSRHYSGKDVRHDEERTALIYICVCMRSFVRIGIILEEKKCAPLMRTTQLWHIYIDVCTCAYVCK